MRWNWVGAMVVVMAVGAWGQEKSEESLAGRGWSAGLVRLMRGEFAWTASGPLVLPAQRAEDPCHAIKDPTVVQHGGRWHVFCTIRSAKRTHQIEYLSFADWKEADKAERHVLKMVEGYFCAPQVFYFAPQKKWYLVFQASDPGRKVQLQPAYSTNEDIANPAGWSKPVFLFEQHPENVRMWIDFWVICDEGRAHLFFTSLDGQMWRSETKLEDFPKGWGKPAVALKGDIFEASHTYRLKGLRRYLTLVEAQDGGRRYYKAYMATRLEGPWTALAETKEKPFASPANVSQPEGRWTDSFSHGELLRTGADQLMEVDPMNLRFLFQGVSDKEKAGKKYGEIPWKLGLLEGGRG